MARKTKDEHFPEGKTKFFEIHKKHLQAHDTTAQGGGQQEGSERSERRGTQAEAAERGGDH